MPSYEDADRVLELTLALENLLEQFDQTPAGYAVETPEGMVTVSEDMESAIDRAQATLNGTEDGDE